MVEPITSHSESKRNSHFPERLLSVQFYAYGSIFIITRSNQGGSSQWAISLCQHLWVAMESIAKSHLYHLAERRIPPLINLWQPICSVESWLSNHIYAHYAEYVWAKCTFKAVIFVRFWQSMKREWKIGGAVPLTLTTGHRVDVLLLTLSNFMCDMCKM